jgi:hypothetical protein
MFVTLAIWSICETAEIHWSIVFSPLQERNAKSLRGQINFLVKHDRTLKTIARVVTLAIRDVNLDVMVGAVKMWRTMCSSIMEGTVARLPAKSRMTFENRGPA